VGGLHYPSGRFQHRQLKALQAYFRVKINSNKNFGLLKLKKNVSKLLTDSSLTFSVAVLPITK
jgi:hypothetical protein